ncbi:phage portal protein, HK97 family [Syntrophomonas wolfei subsp. wolfei str. Goettingen G311]|jgi:phage portal protein BeeE|uniref:Phage portal protein, HK97 family n=1 Tax=Syntrophomonas wolfei subsp. wolfei (strain DSM 2245B / Goettingen) TaxID=335541 RepID=Q0B0J7_SYNWW|nr:phage portal protein, HK97 family [Syntrophomonas wolfei subsp. wolfei str. Goettingen G311]
MKIPILWNLFKSRASPKNSFWQNTYTFFFGPTPSGKTVNERTAMATSAVYACVRVLSETIASLPLQVYYGARQCGRARLHHITGGNPVR